MAAEQLAMPAEGTPAAASPLHVRGPGASAQYAEYADGGGGFCVPANRW